MERDMDRLKELAGHVDLSERNVTPPQAGRQNPASQPVKATEQKDTSAAALKRLERQFSEYLHSLPHLTQEEKHKAWNELVSLFLQAFDHGSSDWMMMSPCILPFCVEASKVMVETIKEKLANRTGEEARIIIEEFLWWNQDVGSSDGWQLLKTIQLLAAADSETLSCIVKTGLPLILLKCLHLFFAFPNKRGVGIMEPETQDKSTVFQETITHIMLYLCSQVSAVEALVQSDDLRCLILTVANQWDQYNSCWRKYMGHVLKAISKTPTKNTVRYLHDSDCIKRCMQSLSTMAERSSVYETAQAAVNVLCFVKDSYHVSPELFNDFESSDGYQLLTTLLLGYNKELEKEEAKTLEELVDFLSSLTIYGQKELKVTPSIAGSQFPNFKFQQPPKSETTVKNLQAFKVLQLVFLKANCSCLSSIILSGIRKIWSWDKANFFLLEWTQQALFQFTEVIYLKSRPVQVQYFQMLRYVVLDLAYIPHEVFSRVQAIIRESLSPACALLALECVLDIAKYDPLLTVVFRETRLLEMLLTQLQRNAKLLKKAGKNVPSNEQEHRREASCLMLQVVAIMLQGSVKNIVILREYGMTPYVKIFLDDTFYRSHALTILEQLFIVNAEEYMRVVIGVLCSATQTELTLKLDLLQSLLNVLGMPKARTAFRTAGGFNALQSVLADMEGALCDPPSGNWATMDQNDIWDLIQSTLCTLTVAMHSDPVNCHFFRTQGQFGKVTEDLRLFGCFSGEGGRLECSSNIGTSRTFEELLTSAHDSKEDIPPKLRKCVKLFGFLDQMAKGKLSSPCSTQQIYLPASLNESCHDNEAEVTGSHCDASNSTEEPAEKLLHAEPEDRFATDPVLVHPGAICVIMDLLPALRCEENPQQSLELQYAVADYILSLVKSDRNRQTMCGSGLLTILMSCCQEALADNGHPLHLPLIRIFEKLACQAIDPPILRRFLRLGDPLNCTVGKTQVGDSPGRHQIDLSCQLAGSNDTDPGQKETVTRRGSLIAKSRPIWGFSISHMSRRRAIPRHRVMSLVSMMSSRHFHPIKSSTAPSFAEFDMSVVGYGCCFLPTLATVGVNAESPIAGGIGEGCRGFPPAAGFTYSTWFSIVSLSSAFDAHPVRFLTLFRHTSKMEKDFTCLSIRISVPAQRLVISTQEEVFEPLDWSDSSLTQQSSALTSVEFNISKYLLLGQWHHLAVVLNKDARKNTTVLAYLNGKVIGTAKIQYIQTFPGMHFSGDSSAVIDVHGIIGTPQIWKQQSSLIWRLGPTCLFEEVSPPETVQAIYELGPNYLGNFQSVHSPGDDLTNTSMPSVFVSEEKLSFGINVVSSAVMTIKDIRNHYNEVDSRLISSELGISSRDDAMPIVLAKNMATHLPGPARTIGAPIASFFGVRTFFSNPAANCLQFVGGPAVILGLVAMASDDHEMYAAVKVLISVLNSSTLSEKEMRRIEGYRLLALLIRRRVRLLNARIFQLILTIVGTAELGQGTSTIRNDCAFRDLLCDFEIWLNSPETLDLLLFKHFLELLSSSQGPQGTRDFIVGMDLQRKTGQELFASLHKDHWQMQQCVLNQTSKDWAKTEQQLLQERGLWGPSSGSQQDAWILDMAEGPCRVRKKMRRNTVCINCADNACRAKEAKSEVSNKLELSFGNEESYMKLCSTVEHLGTADKQFYPAEGLPAGLTEEDIDERGIDCNQLTFFPALIESIQPEEFFEDCVERQAILQVLDAKEKINMKYSLIIGDGHLLMESVLLFGRNHFYICENFTLSASGDVYCINHHPSSINDSYIYDMCNKETGGKKLKCSQYSYNDVADIHQLRFLLQDIALEIFFKNGFSKFLIFQKNDRKKVYKKFCNANPSVKKGKTDGFKNVGRTLGEKVATQKWQKGEISNFEYLMHLNTSAGRTYNDLMQYPIFPWILADYDSEELDLTNAKMFRDLSKPMGAQTEGRKEKFVQRYFEVDNDEDLSARCHYCTHYSSSIIVASYLVRMEPFTQTFCSLQGGCFDVADRMFFSIKRDWESSSRDNMSDVRELIPEFFYLPDFLLNHNRLEFGSMQDGTTLGDVILPPWAKGDAQEFIRLHRMALESDYVSANLHHWIDLIFGYKQQGSAAVEAINVFHPYFYDDQADLRTIKDPLRKHTIMGFVNNFGQIPKQLFSKAHPPRIIPGRYSLGKDLVASPPALLPFFYHLENLKPSGIPVKELLKGPVGHIVHTEKGVLAVEKNKLLIPSEWNKTFSWGYNDFSCSLGIYTADKNLTVFECLSDWGQCLCAACPTPTIVITGGSSSVICVWEIPANKDKAKSMILKEVLHGHIEAVTCLAVSSTYNVIVSGSCDRTGIIWDFNTLTYVSQLQGHKETISAISINDVTGDIASCAGKYLHLWTINGQPIASINTSPGLTEEILCCCFTEVHEWNPRNVVVTGCSDGVVRLWRTEYRRSQVAKNDGGPASEQNGYRWERHLVLCQELSRNSALSGKQRKRLPAVTALAISRNHAKLLAGDSWGRVYCWSVEG
ncbi:WD repeat- and FYVE domain-containing protein 4 [Mustelus asterias]